MENTLDIIDMILSQYTDFRKFERLCNVLMEREGYHNIKPIGGIHDEGIDAEQVSYHDAEGGVIFQYSMQVDVKIKITGTYDKLKVKHPHLKNLVIVTSTPILNKQEVKTTFRKKYGATISLEIYDKELFLTRLSSDPVLVAQYFPDIKAQIKSDLFKTNSELTNDKQEATLLKVAASVLRNHKSANIATKKVFDTLVLCCIYEAKETDLLNIISELKKKHGICAIESQILASLERLKKANQITIIENCIKVSIDEAIRIESEFSNLQARISSLCTDIIEVTENLLRQKLIPGTRDRMRQNIQLGISAYFKYTAAEQVSSTAYEFDIDSYGLALDEIKRSLQPNIGEVLIFAIGKVLSSPTIEQQEIFSDWHKITIGMQVIKADPKQRNLSGTTLKNTNYILDTDFLLNAYVKENNTYPIFKKVISTLGKYEAKIIVPEQVVEEVVKHAETAERNVNYFFSKFEALDFDVIFAEVTNVFARGYLLELSKGANLTFKTYMQNYYDSKHPIEFIKQCMNHEFANKIEYIDLTKNDLPDDDLILFEQLKIDILEQTKKTEKSTFRTEPENAEIANVDASIFIYAHSQNKTTGKTSNFLPKNVVLTDSTRSIRCAKKIGIKQDFYVKILNIAYLIEQIEPYEITYSDLMNVFKNPFLAYSVHSNWKHIECALKFGMNLKGANITRLKMDLKESITEVLTDKTITEQSIVEDAKFENLEPDATVNVIERLRVIGYTFVTSIDKMAAKYEKLQNENAALKFAIEEKKQAEKEIEKARKKYLKRVKNSKNK